MNSIPFYYSLTTMCIGKENILYSERKYKGVTGHIDSELTHVTEKQYNQLK